MAPRSFDVTDKNTTNIISRTSYEGAAFVHQGWVLDVNYQKYLVLDEYDEYDGTGEGAAGYPITDVWDISSLEAPKQTGFYRHARKGIDHNRMYLCSPSSPPPQPQQDKNRRKGQSAGLTTEPLRRVCRRRLRLPVQLRHGPQRAGSDLDPRGPDGRQRD